MRNFLITSYISCLLSGCAILPPDKPHLYANAALELKLNPDEYRQKFLQVKYECLKETQINPYLVGPALFISL